MPRAPRSKTGTPSSLTDRIKGLGGTPPAPTRGGAPASAALSQRPADHVIGDRRERLAIARIRRDGGTQPRAGIHAATVTEYHEALAKGATFPAVVVYFDGTDYWLADGYHRLEAHVIDQRTDIEAVVRLGTRRDAVLCAAGSNATHGLRRTAADKRRAIELVLGDAEWAKNSDRWIAEACMVTDKTVAVVRKALGGETTERVGKDGRRRRVPVARPETALVPPPVPSLTPDGAARALVPDVADATPTSSGTSADVVTDLRHSTGGRSLTDIGLTSVPVRVPPVVAGSILTADQKARAGAMVTVEESLDYLLSIGNLPTALEAWAKHGLQLLRSP